MTSNTTHLPRSLYADTACPPIFAPTLRGMENASVVIVGGGFTGLSTALHLCEIGVDTVVLEAHEPGWGASGRNGGQVNPGFYLDPDTVIEDFGAEMGRRMLNTTSIAPDLVFDVIRRYNIDCEAVQSGTLRLAFNRTMLKGSVATLEQLTRTGSPASWVERADAERLTGSTRYLGGIFFPQGGKVNPLGYARGLALAATQMGARIYGDSAAVKIARIGAKWRVQTQHGIVTADHAVLATNAYTDGLWPGLKKTVVPVYSTIVATEPLSARIVNEVLPSGAVVYEIANNTVYYRLDAQNRLLMGGEGLQKEVTEFKDARALTDYTAKLFPQLKDIRWDYVWNGKLAITPDFYIHMHEPADNLHICLGYSGRGVAMGTMMGKILAERVNGASVDDLPMPITTMKEMPLHRFHRIGVKARLLYGRYKDILDG